MARPEVLAWGVGIVAALLLLELVYIARKVVMEEVGEVVQGIGEAPRSEGDGASGEDGGGRGS